jgi:rhodanese-related sulfurtransferase
MSKIVWAWLLAGVAACAGNPSEPEAASVFDGVIEGEGPTSEISTAQLQSALAEGHAVVLDARPYDEYAVSHIPGARAVRGKPGTTAALYTADVNEILETVPDKGQRLILYCNGLHCGRSKRLSEELGQAGYTAGQRYQLGAPGWRALGGVMQVEKPALLRLLQEDRTAMLVDAREPGATALRGAVRASGRIRAESGAKP